MAKIVAWDEEQMGYGRRRFTAAGFRCQIRVEETLAEWTCRRGSATVVVDSEVF